MPALAQIRSDAVQESATSPRVLQCSRSCPACSKRPSASAIGEKVSNLAPVTAFAPHRCTAWSQATLATRPRRGNTQMDRIERIGQVAEIMRDYVENKKTFLTDSTKRVPVRSFTDPDQWKAEMELIFKRVPLMLAFTAEMPNPGDYKAMDAVGMPVLINRDKTGKVRAFLNVCSHRGAPVANEGHGNCPRFTCKYHGWTFGQDGKLIGISEASKFGEVQKSELGLRELPCQEKAGM